MDHHRSTKRVIKSFDEQDLYTRWRHLLLWQAGERKKIKRRTHKRERRAGKAEGRLEATET